MSDFDAQIRESQSQVSEAQSKIAELTSRIETARQKMAEGTDIAVDIENASLDDVHAHTEVMNANIAELIMGLDDVTAGFQQDFDEMRSKTGWESFVGIFSKGKSESMRQERMRTATIDDKLQDLISKSDTITKLLEGQLAVLNEQKDKVETNLGTTLTERETVVAELETLKADIKGMDPKIIELENKISVEQDAAARTALETELAELNAKYNEMVQQEQVKIANSQTLERYIEKGKTWIDSLQNQAATQMVLINKLQTDTQQRVVLYDALTKSLKTAQQQKNVGNPIFIRLGNRGSTFGRRGEKSPVGTVKNIRISDVVAEVTVEDRAKAAAVPYKGIKVDTTPGVTEKEKSKAGPIMITGIPGHYVENVVLENVAISYPGHGTEEDAKRIVPEDQSRYPEQFFFGVLPAWGAYVRHAKNIKFKNVER